MLHKNMAAFLCMFFPTKEFLFLPNEIDEKDAATSSDHLL